MRKLFLSFIASSAGVLLLAQANPTPPPTTTNPPAGGNPTTPGGGGRPPTGIPQQQQPQQQMPQMPQIIFFSGKVVMEDGTPPTEPVTIEQVCNGQPRPQAYTDGKGRWSYRLESGGDRRNGGMNNNNGMIPDASMSNSGTDAFGDGFGTGMGNRMGNGMDSVRMNLMGCEIRASLAGYRSSSVMLANRSSLDNPDVGMIILKPLGNRDGSVFSATNAMAPKDAKKAVEKGREFQKKKKNAEAMKEFAKAVEIYPKFASAWYEIGLMEEANANAEGARKAYAAALVADPKYVNPYTRLFMMSVAEQKWPDVADTTARLLRLNPYDFPNAYYYNAIANFNLKKYDEAEKSAKSLYEQDPKRFARAGYVLGLVMAQKSDFAMASTHLKKYLENDPNASDRDTVTKQLAEIERIAANPEQKP